MDWRESVPPYAQTAAEGIPNGAYVHTVQNEVWPASSHRLLRFRRNDRFLEVRLPKPWIKSKLSCEFGFWIWDGFSIKKPALQSWKADERPWFFLIWTHAVAGSEIDMENFTNPGLAQSDFEEPGPGLQNGSGWALTASCHSCSASRIWLACWVTRANRFYWLAKPGVARRPSYVIAWSNMAETSARCWAWRSTAINSRRLVRCGKKCPAVWSGNTPGRTYRGETRGSPAWWTISIWAR